MDAEKEEAWITGIGIVSTLGDGCEANWQALAAGRPAVDQTTFSPYIVHPIAAVDFCEANPQGGPENDGRLAAYRNLRCWTGARERRHQGECERALAHRSS